MAHNAYIRAAGVWNLLSVLTSPEMATFDLRQYQSINGDLGGTWTPAAQIILGGSGLRVTGPSQLDDAAVTITSGKKLTVNNGGAIDALASSTSDFAGAVNIKSGATATLKSGATWVAENSSTTTLNGAVTLGTTGSLTTVGAATVLIQNTITIAGGAVLTCNAASTTNLNGAVAVGATGSVTTNAASTCTFNGAVVLNGATTIDGTPTVTSGTTLAFAAGSQMTAAATAPFALANVVTCTGTVYIETGATLLVNNGTFETQSTATVTRGADETVTGTVTRSGVGAYVNVRVQAGVNANHTYNAREFDILVVPALGANYVYTMSDLGASDRVMVYIDRNKNISGNTLTLRRDDLTDFATFGSALGGAAQIYWDGTSWNKLVYSAGVS